MGRRNYLLLPKMTRAQFRTLAGRLGRAGYVTSLSESLSARSRTGSIHIRPSGVCWSTADAGDAVLPAVPGILNSPKDHVPMKTMKSMYFTMGKRGSGAVVRIPTRIESYSLWDELRARGSSGLAPDEHAVARFLISRASACRLLGDFPAYRSKMRVCGRRSYFDSKMSRSRAGGTLRVVGTRALSNSYLNRDELLELHGFVEPSHGEWAELFDMLGEWCYFAPT